MAVGVKGERSERAVCGRRRKTPEHELVMGAAAPGSATCPAGSTIILSRCRQAHRTEREDVADRRRGPGREVAGKSRQRCPARIPAANCFSFLSAGLNGRAPGAGPVGAALRAIKAVESGQRPVGVLRRHGSGNGIQRCEREEYWGVAPARRWSRVRGSGVEVVWGAARERVGGESMVDRYDASYDRSSRY
jgi:hypothetical protein